MDVYISIVKNPKAKWISDSWKSIEKKPRVYYCPSSHDNRIVNHMIVGCYQLELIIIDLWTVAV